MGIFTRKKNKKLDKANSIDDAFNRVYSQIDKIDSWDDPKKLEHYILDSCEQIIASTKEMERQKNEYRVVTSYLNDIKTIENLSYEEAKDLRGTAARIIELEASILAVKQTHRNISDEQFEIIALDENEMAEIINRLAADERYQDKVKRDMAYLEGEKTRWEIERDSLKTKKKLLKKMAMVIFTSFTALVLLLFTIINASGADLSLALVIIFFICAISAFIIFLRQNSISRENRKALVYLNQSISLLNVQRMKYVNVTNGIEYQKDKYKVESAAELQYVWEQYIDKVKDQKRYIKNNDDLDFYNSKLVRIIASLPLNDKKIWVNQVNALMDKNEMAECRHRLVVRRQKIRDRIEENKRMVQNERDEIDRLMNEHEHYLPEIQEIIKSVDKLCGTSSSADKKATAAS